jgi:hypothetical protein
MGKGLKYLRAMAENEETHWVTHVTSDGYWEVECMNPRFTKFLRLHWRSDNIVDATKSTFDRSRMLQTELQKYWHIFTLLEGINV